MLRVDPLQAPKANPSKEATIYTSHVGASPSSNVPLQPSQKAIFFLHGGKFQQLGGNHSLLSRNLTI